MSTNKDNQPRKIIQISPTRGADGVPILFALDGFGDTWAFYFRTCTWEKLPNLPTYE